DAVGTSGGRFSMRESPFCWGDSTPGFSRLRGASGMGDCAATDDFSRRPRSPLPRWTRVDRYGGIRRALPTRDHRLRSKLSSEKWRQIIARGETSQRTDTSGACLPVLAQLQPADLAAMHLVGAVGETQRAGVGPPEGERERLADAAAAVDLHGAVE